MYGHDSDDTGELPRIEPQRSWTFDQHPIDQNPIDQPRTPYQSPASPGEPTAGFAVPSSHRVRGRYGDGYPRVDREPYRSSHRGTAWWRSRGAIAVGLSVLAVLLIGTAGFAWLRPDPDPAPLAIDPSPTASATEAAAPSATLSPTPSPKPSPTPAATRTRNPVPTAPPTTPPPAAEVPPAPVVNKTPDPTCTPTYNGTNASKPAVRDALVASGATQFWVGVQRPADLEGPLPVITVPANLMKAIAWQESGWQSAIIACDGGIGTMQIMPGTVTQINNRFGTSHNVNTLDGNTDLGANYLQWLIMYFGLFYFGQNFDLPVAAPIGAGGAELSLLEVVVAAYNVGPAALENDDNTLSIPNWSYVNNVLALTTSCECLAF
jgi:hypothetical protein